VIFGTGGAAFVLGLSGAPSVFLLVHGALGRVNPSLEDAARGLGLGPLRVFFQVTVPLLRGPLIAGSLLVFLYACVDFGVVSLLRARTVTTVLFTYLSTGFAPHASAAIALLLVALLWVVLAAQDRAGRLGVGAATGRHGDAGIGALADQRGRRDARPVALGRLRPLAIIFVGVVTGLGVAVPVLTLTVLALSLGPTALVRFWGAQGEYLLHTVQIGAATATLATGGGLALAFARGRGRVATLAIGASQVGYALPGTVLALAIVGLVPRWLPWVDGTAGEIVLAVAILTFTPAFQSCRTALDSVPRTLVDAARGLGETSLGAFRRITLPIAGPAMLSGWSLAFGLAARELAATLIVRPPGYDTLAVRLWVHTRRGRLRCGSAVAETSSRDDSFGDVDRQLVRFAEVMFDSALDVPDPATPVAPDIDRMRATFPRGVGAPALRALAAAGFGDLDALDGASIAHLKSLHGMGPKALSVLEHALAARGKAFRA
jgi:iron(III) transport system permease protein